MDATEEVVTMSVCEVMELPVEATEKPREARWRLTRDENPDSDGIYLVAVRYRDGREEVRRYRYNYALNRWGGEIPWSASAIDDGTAILAWSEVPPFPDVPWVADSFKDDATETTWQIFSDGIVFKQAAGMKSPRRDRAAENNPAIHRILQLAGVRP